MTRRQRTAQFLTGHPKKAARMGDLALVGMTGYSPAFCGVAADA